MSSKIKGPRPDRRARVMVTESNTSVAAMVRAQGGEVVGTTYARNVHADLSALAGCHGLVITGGNDVNPALYGHERDPETQPVAATRDYRELALLGAARRLGIPVLGICRGMQVITVEAGGTLWQHVPDRVHHHGHGFSMAPVRTVRGSLVQRTLGDRPNVLHLHHQSLRRTPDGFLITARAEDGIVEAIESTDGRVVATQFHPESEASFTKPGDGCEGYRLFDAFVRSCSRYRRRTARFGVPSLGDLSLYGAAWPVAKAEYDKPVPTWTAKPTLVEAWRKSDKRHGRKALPPGLVVGDKRPLPVAWCGLCGMAFDDKQDHRDHVSYFHSYVDA